MGLMLGEFVDEYTVNVIDVFAMPQSGTVSFALQFDIIYDVQGVSVEAVDPVFQAKMLDMLKQTGRPEMVVGWLVYFLFQFLFAKFMYSKSKCVKPCLHFHFISNYGACLISVHSCCFTKLLSANIMQFRYHSHPGFGCWLSGVDINTQQSFEALSERAVAVVVDPIQSVKGKVSSFQFCCR